jgi:hypothetical protein
MRTETNGSSERSRFDLPQRAQIAGRGALLRRRRRPRHLHSSNYAGSAGHQDRQGGFV